MWQLTELVILDLSYNKDLTGTISPSINNLKKLTSLVLVDCNFYGSIPDTIGSMESLIKLSLNSNGFTGEIPSSLGNLLNLDCLDLAGNKLSGAIPVSSGTTPGLDMMIRAKHLLFDNNKLSDNIPATIGLLRQWGWRCSYLLAKLHGYINCSLSEEMEIAAVASKLAECQATIYHLGRQLKALNPMTETNIL